MCTVTHRPSGFSDSRIVLYVASAVIGMTSLATIGQALDAVPHLESRTGPAVAAPAPSNQSAPTPSTPSLPAPAPTPIPGNPPSPSFPPPPPEYPDEQPVDPQECRNVQRQVRDHLREMRRIESTLKKAGLTKDLETIAALRAKSEAFQASFKDGCTRDEVQEFHDAQPWETINELRAKAELPKQHKQIERELKRLERRLTPRTLQATGLDAEKLKVNVAAIRKAVEDSKAALASGDYEEANEAMQTIWQGMHPGEIMGVLDRLREVQSSMKRVRDQEIRTQLLELIAPIIDSANEGDFRDANQAMNEVFPELQRLLFQLTQRRSVGDFDEKFDRLEALIQAKLGGASGPSPSSGPGDPTRAPGGPTGLPQPAGSTAPPPAP